jgi:reactive intermediate/imine deaminase
MNYIFGITMVCFVIVSVTAKAQDFKTSKTQTLTMDITQQSETTVRNFLQIVRAGKAPERAPEFMAAEVLANQLNAENPQTIIRTPQNYAEHIHDFIAIYGNFDFEITELIANNDKVYVRWKQTGKQVGDVDGFKATGLPVTEISSCIYRLEHGKIVEYWIQTDRKGTELQLQANQITKADSAKTALPFADAVHSGDVVYISGQVGVDHTTGKLVDSNFEAEAQQVMENLGMVLRKYKLHYRNLINVTIYLTSMDNYAAANKVYSKFFDHTFPARVCIAVKELPRKAHIEIAAIADTRN